MLTFAASIRGIQSAEVSSETENYLNEFCGHYQVDWQVKDVDQAAEEKVPIIVDKTSTMWVIHIMFWGLEWAHIDTHITGL